MMEVWRPGTLTLAQSINKVNHDRNELESTTRSVDATHSEQQAAKPILLPRVAHKKQRRPQLYSIVGTASTMGDKPDDDAEAKAAKASKAENTF